MSMKQTITTELCSAVLCICIVLCGGANVSAQTRRRAAQPPPPARTAPTQTPAPIVRTNDNTDISITANVTARSLRFDEVPNPTVEFYGHPQRETVWDAQRTNLPRPVQPGVTYRDIGIRLTITSVFADIDRIVAEALGEVPPTSDATPPTNDSRNGNPTPSNQVSAPANKAHVPIPASPQTLRAHSSDTAAASRHARLREIRSPR